VAAGLLLGTALDAVVPDPRRGHPVALFGSAAAELESRVHADDRARGVLFTAACVGTALAVGVGLRRAGVAGVALATWSVLGARSLRAEGRAVHDLLAIGDLAAAREQVTHLVGRDPSRLDALEVARAALESVAENTCDAVVAPLFWGAVAGAPGLLGYRAVNTLDAMVGHRSARHANFGWASARLDDAANWAPARLSAGLTAAAARVAGASASGALRVAARDAGKHPSPNSGWSEAAFAGALGVRLGGRNVYDDRVEDRPRLGDGRPVEVDDLRRATRLCAAVTVAAAIGAVVLADRGVFSTAGGEKSPRSGRR